MSKCPYCNIEVRESDIESEDGCCPECGAMISAPDLGMSDDEIDDNDEFDYDDEEDIFGDLDEDDEFEHSDDFDEEDFSDLDDEFGDEEFDEDEEDEEF